ncbi:MAG: chemotaxis protein CheB [Desulfuromonadales bacterium]
MKPSDINIGGKKTAVPEAVPSPTHYVGIGASAGGLEAIESFFTNMPVDSKLAFIVVQHLSPDYKSLMVELLSKKTAMPVNRAEDGMLVKPDNIYLIPPKKNLTIFHGRLLLSEQDHTRGINLPIDVFLRSLAEDQAEKAVAIILSGTGSDGMRGVRTVKECGGIVMVQDEESAKFDGMPRSAISTGLADFILPPEKMPGQLLAFAQHPYITDTERSDTLLSDEDGLTRIFALLREKCKIDFTYYKPSTVTRRIERRMTVNQTENIKDYLAFMINYPGEVVALYRELLIGVTSFFRDQGAFDYLSEVILPEIFKNSSKREVRFWVSACSTGEEAYSLAILAKECMESLGLRHDVKIFATDIDRDAIHFAASGSYPESVAADIPPRFLSKYFHKRDDNFQIVRAIREMVVFAQHNLIKDPPFTNIDLLSCRNILIYLQPVLQRKVMEFFNFSLVPGGIMFLGSSETTGEMSDYFDPLEQKFKFFRARGRVRQLGDAVHMPAVTDTRYRELKGHFSTVRRSLRANEEERHLERFLNAAVGDYLPLSFLVNEHLEVLQIIGDADGYLKLPSGKVVNDISKMAIKEISIPLATGIQKVFREHQELRFSNIRITRHGVSQIINLRIKPLPHKVQQEPLVAVFIDEVKREEAGSELPVLSYDLSKEAEERMHDLEQELQFTRENLQATIEELETSNEELQATNEELLASNEELQSTNEELQSTNEELFTVNAEYQSKIIELTELHNDVDNLLSATQIGNLLLDENMEVRRFSKRITEVFKLLDSDVGRPITHISHYLVNVDPLKIVRDVQHSCRQVELEVQTQTGQWQLMRVVPYMIGPKAFSGTILSFVDISELKRAEEVASSSRVMAQITIDSLSSNICVLDEQGVIMAVNKAWRDFSLNNQAEFNTVGIGVNYLDVCSSSSGGDSESALCFRNGIRAVMNGSCENFEMEYPCHSPDQNRWFIGRVTPYIGSGAGLRKVVITHEDITSRKLAIEALRVHEDKLHIRPKRTERKARS